LAASAVEPRPDRYASLPPAQIPPPAADTAPPSAAATVAPAVASAAFTSAWTDAHDKLAASRYAEALAALSVWYDDPSLGLEESQRLEDLLGQLAGTVIYSQQDLMLPPHVVAPGETLATIAAALAVSPQLLAKINGVDDPSRLLPGEHLKVIRGPFDAVVSVSRRRVSLQLNGSYAGSFPAVVGRQFLDRVGGSLPVVEVSRGEAPAGQPATLRRRIALGDGLVIEAVDDPGIVTDNAPQSSLVVSVRDLDELIDILGPGSRVLVRQ
jgi:LysM repeat protein